MRINTRSIRFVGISSHIDEEKKHTIEVLPSVISYLSDGGILLVCFLFAYLCICFLMQKTPVEEVLLCTINVHLVVAQNKKMLLKNGRLVDENRKWMLFLFLSLACASICTFNHQNIFVREKQNGKKETNRMISIVTMSYQ